LQYKLDCAKGKSKNTQSAAKSHFFQANTIKETAFSFAESNWTNYWFSIAELGARLPFLFEEVPPPTSPDKAKELLAGFGFVVGSKEYKSTHPEVQVIHDIFVNLPIDKQEEFIEKATQTLPGLF